MIRCEGFLPNQITFVALLTASAHAGWWRLVYNGLR
uniref:Uncharacterized protein n=1 Tax=Arundo donax TaxID=35708 RepID=A0A0A9BCZ2_ARUDO